MGYISKNRVGQILFYHSRMKSDEVKDLLEKIALDVHAEPDEEMMPVVFGRWYWDEDGMDWGIGAWRCSACEAMSPMWWNTDKGSPMHKSGHRFCPNCGSCMSEKEGVQ